MTKDELKQLFKAHYSADTFKYLVKNLFPFCDLFATPVITKELPATKQEMAKSIAQLGTCTLQDKSKIAFYQVELTQGKKVAHNRVGLRNLLINELQPGDIDGIFASFYNPTVKEWRVSFLSQPLSWDNEMRQVKTETSPRRYTFVVGENETIATAVERFERLLQKAGAIALEHILEAFSVEKISEEFFTSYRHQFEIFCEYVIDSAHFTWFRQKARELHADDMDEQAQHLARNFVKKLLGRIVFLYFLQKKGWLGVPKGGAWGEGPKNFVGELFKKFEHKNNFYADCLVPLFFNTLNKKRENDLFPITKTRIPYLNGGLFDKDPIEPEDTKFKANLFEELFVFFDSYNFTIDENSPEDQDIGIDPEMLGRIFENLLEENIRNQKGTFYTPKDVVHFMCKEALRCFIREKLADKALPQELKAIDAFMYELPEINLPIIKKYATAIDHALTGVKICDPAIGSGAFPMGMVYEILRLKKELFGFSATAKTFDYGKAKLDIIRNSIYGVDVDQGAIDIARLRFWLSLIVDEETPRPLPNLDYKIMQGDSLREWYEDIALHNLVTDEDRPLFLEEPKLDFGYEYDPQKKLVLTITEKTELKGLVSAYFGIEDLAEKKRIHKQIDTVVDKHLKSNVERKKKFCQEKVDRKQSELEEIEKRMDAKHRNQLPKYKKLQKDLKEELADLKEIQAEEQRLIEIETAIEKPFFLWNLFFGDVLVENSGFDIVIGNPPYGVKIDDKTEEFYGISSKDSYGAFMSLGLKKLLKTNGTLCFIVSDTWLTIKSHLPLRKQILEYQLQKVIRLHQDCFHATVNSCIVTVRKEIFDKEKQNAVIAADYTNISTRKETAKFREKLVRVSELVGESTKEFGVYGYEQGLLGTNHNCPVIVGSPKLFELMNDTSSENEIIKITNDKEIKVNKVLLNNKKMELVKFGDIAEVNQGLATGDNEYYLYQLPQARGNYKDITKFTAFLLAVDDLIKIRTNEELRLRVIEKGIHKTKEDKGFEKDRYFGGRFILPYDKGGESDTDTGWLPNYHVPTDYFIDWSVHAVKRLKTYKIADRIRDRKEDKTIKGIYETTNAAVIRNPNTYFLSGITFSRTGIYSPSFRLNSASIYDTEGSTILLSTGLCFNTSLAILISRFYRYILKIFIGHTVHTQVDELKDAPFVITDSIKINQLVLAIIGKQKQNLHYDYFSHEQKQIDSLVYQLYNLSPSDINEVETWFARRYPKLAKYADIKSPEELLPQAATTQDETIAKYKALIALGETHTVEFKQTLRYDIRTKQTNKDLEFTCLKNIAAFLNSEGGTLFIGVRDEDSAITGLNDDFNTFTDNNKHDTFLLHFDNLIATAFGNAIQSCISVDMPEIDGVRICVVSVKAGALSPMYLDNKQKNSKDEFYIRRSASAVSLTPRETVQYIGEHWKQKEAAI